MIMFFYLFNQTKTMVGGHGKGRVGPLLVSRVIGVPLKRKATNVFLHE